ncbi:hypothetical protein C4D60_Mb08t10240 [Musa balbisiana]|uniref:non-specific serine/threonine protein kinase n=1 Tax=Musa balbisiana TaxID=52838 RepID=A0A4S8K2Q1_MUSBA|nr:hypothetical protein C4D60_Mb08t10240 [Musa balbisiana]
MVKEGREGAARVLGKYELGRTLGEGNFGKVKHARHVETGETFAVKILDRKRILSLKVDDQIKREIATLKLLKHPNVVRLHEVSASKTKIYMVLEYVNGGELFDKINDGLLHTTCGSPNYIAPEVLSNRGYDGSRSDIWSCGVILYVILTGFLPFDDRNLAVLYQKISKGETEIPKWLSPGAQNILKRILDPNPIVRINMAGIKADDWFKQDYAPIVPNDDDDDKDIDSLYASLCIKEHNVPDEDRTSSSHINAFQLIGMSSSLDLSGFFENEDVSERKIRFTSTHAPKHLFNKIEDIATEMGLQAHKGPGKLKVTQKHNPESPGSTGSLSVAAELKVTQKHNPESPGSTGSLSVAAEVFELSPSLYVVELRKSQGDSSLYRKMCAKLSENWVTVRDNSSYRRPRCQQP